MNLHILPNDSTPIYQQIVNQVKYMISSGQLRPGDILPPIRTLSESIIVNANTVARAYRDLERDGFVKLQRGIGTTVRATGSPLSKTEQQEILAERASALISEARQMNMNLEDILEVVRAQAEKMNLLEKENVR